MINSVWSKPQKPQQSSWSVNDAENILDVFHWESGRSVGKTNVLSKPSHMAGNK